VALALGLPAPTPHTAPKPPPSPPHIEPAPRAAQGALTLTGGLSHSVVLPGASTEYATFDIKATDVPGGGRTPVNVALVIDRSGSMHGRKMADAKRAAGRLVDLLEPTDRLSIVHYGNDVTVFSGQLATAEGKLRMHRFVQAIDDVGGTIIGDALTAGARQLRMAEGFRVNRLILLSDGQPTVGITSQHGLSRLATQLREQGLSITSLGVGADFNEDLMQQLADVGGGAFGFVSERDAEALATVFEKDLSQAATVVASHVVLELTAGAGVTLHEVYGRPVTREGERLLVSLSDFSARQLERLVVRLTVQGGAPGATAQAINARLRYNDLLANGPAHGLLALDATFSSEVELKNKSANPLSVVFATRARASQNYEKAATALAEGHTAEAEESLKQNARLFDEAQRQGEVAPDAFDADVAANLAAARVASQPTPEPVRRESAKALKVQGLKSAGRGESLY
jgi:Ca-activated chloride channel homolog